MELFLPHGPLGGRVASIASKSQLQRLLLCAALADRETVVHGASDAADVQAMCRCLRALGAQITSDGRALRVQPVTEQAHGAADCGESGATLRFLLPVAAALGRETTFRLHGRLPQRPLGPLWEALEAHGVRLSRPAPGELLCAGRLENGRFLLPGDVSSQFFSGLLFALPLPDGPSELHAVTPPESAGYIAMTLAALRRFGIATEPLPDGWAVPRRAAVPLPRRGPGGGRLVERGLLACGGRALAAGDCHGPAGGVRAGRPRDSGVSAPLWCRSCAERRRRDGPARAAARP